MRALLKILVALAVIAGAAFWFLTEPQPVEFSRVQQLITMRSDAARGEQVFWAGGCASCHAAAGAEGDARLVLSGGVRLKSDFGTFVAPNISPDPVAGIGNWTIAEFANAMLAGVAPDGGHYYPSFPYGSYSRMSDADIADLYAFLNTLPPSGVASAPHELAFPFSVRRLVGGWKLLYFNAAPRVTLASADAVLARGQYLVEGPGHCGECHTPRDLIGGFRSGEWLAGAPNPEGEGIIPNITPGGSDISGWSAGDIATYLETGFTPDFDTVGGSMVEVVRNLAHLPASDREAIAAYLKAIPARPNGYSAAN
ncbi:mono/diheme cytochrome c family protein [Hoeflea marina]|uniref:Mono/diheme cytochrome c family protein n=1 Tax=Hoeflea marina TaxID=274592 RepID=A0A317PMP7_9HYPH|nr:cytochrome c [Hoeflea marina]PWW02172.1 mono/diheme cytochrome c family protein [Hoeflea marina]